MEPMNESGPCRESAVESLRKLAEEAMGYSDQYRRQANGFKALADQLDAIAAHAATFEGDTAPHIGVGSDAEHALWSLAQNFPFSITI